MEETEHKACFRKDIFEDFKSLKNSDYWPYLSPKNQEDILSLLAGHLVEPVKSQ